LGWHAPAGFSVPVHLFRKFILHISSFVIIRRYPLEQIPEAFQYIEKGHKKGNVVITLEHDGKI
jgi:hypothetical protein